jgi:pimeloyl-ACP methyl ester carboxylesterase
MTESDLLITHYRGSDGADLVYRELGPTPGSVAGAGSLSDGKSGRPLVLLHGFLSTATMNWIRYGHAARLAGLGYRVVMPDLRAHGASARSHSADDYPPDVLADDGVSLLEHLGVGGLSGGGEPGDFDLGGYSLGGRTVMRLLVRGVTPGRAIVAGIGLDGMVRASDGGDRFQHILTSLGTFEQGSPEWMVEAFLKTTGGDAAALVHIVETAVDTPVEEIARVTTPTLVVRGAEDSEHASAQELASVLPQGHYMEIPGTHMSAVTKPDLGIAIGEFLGRV